MTETEFIEVAKTNAWNRKQTRNELFKANDPALWGKRDEVLVALGFAVTAQPVTAQPVAPPPVAAQPAKKKSGRGVMSLKYPATDVLTGKWLAAGSEALGVKLGGEWDFTAEPIDYATFKHLREAMLLSLVDDDESVLDHEDYYILEEFGQKYPRIVSMIGCRVPGLE